MKILILTQKNQLKSSSKKSENSYLGYGGRVHLIYVVESQSINIIVTNKSAGIKASEYINSLVCIALYIPQKNSTNEMIKIANKSQFGMTKFLSIFYLLFGKFIYHLYTLYGIC